MIAIVVDSHKVKRKLKEFPKLYKDAVQGFYYRAGALTQRQMRIEAPKGVSGIGVGETITFDVKKDEVVISPKKKYGKYDARVIEFGRKPGKMPPWTEETNPDFVKWADVHGIPPFALAKHIGEHGTKPNPFVQRTRDAVEPRIIRWIRESTDKLIEEMNR